MTTDSHDDPLKVLTHQKTPKNKKKKILFQLATSDRCTSQHSNVTTYDQPMYSMLRSLPSANITYHHTCSTVTVETRLGSRRRGEVEKFVGSPDKQQRQQEIKLSQRSLQCQVHLNL